MSRVICQKCVLYNLLAFADQSKMSEMSKLQMLQLIDVFALINMVSGFQYNVEVEREPGTSKTKTNRT